MAVPSRKHRVLQLLRDNFQQWVTTADIEDVNVGAAEGTRRLRELRKTGYAIEKRRHPDPRRTVFQYRLMQWEPGPQATLPSPAKPAAPAVTKSYRCPKGNCKHDLFYVRASDFDPRYGYGRCIKHGLQQVRL